MTAIQHNDAPRDPWDSQGLRDRAEIGDLVDRYLRSLDERDSYDEAWARSYYTEDIRLHTPVGDAEGWQAVARRTDAALAPFERTQHLGANCLVDLDGDRAAVRCNALMTHLHPAGAPDRLGERFTVGGVIEAEAARTRDGWRFRRMAIHAVWHHGQPPAGD